MEPIYKPKMVNLFLGETADYRQLYNVLKKLKFDYDQN